MFINGGVFVIDVFSHAIMDEACGATNVLLTAAIARELVYCILRKHNPVLDKAFVSCVFALRRGVG